MKTLLSLILLVTIAFSFDINEAKKLLDSNNTQDILSALKSKDGYYYLGTAIKEGRNDILDLAIKNHFDFNQTNNKNSTLLDLSAFFLNKEAVQKLAPIINPNHITKSKKNAIKMLLTGVYQVNRWILYPKEKLTKMFKDDKYTEDEMEKSFMLYEKLRKDALDIIDILKQNGARFEQSGTYPNEITFFKAAREGKIKKGSYKYKFYEKLLDDKGKFFFYVGMDEFEKAKKFLSNHPWILKEPCFLDYERHFFYVLQRDSKYCDLAEFMIKKAFENNFNIIDYIVTNDKTEVYWDAGYKEECFEKLYTKYEPKPKYDFEMFDIFKFMMNKNYENIDKYTSDPGWNFTVFRDDIPLEYRPSFNDVMGNNSNENFFLEALLGEFRDAKTVKIILKNGGYMSDWNELHYAILEHKPLHLKSYKKWERVFKLNQGDLALGLTPLYLAVLENDFELVKKLIANGANPNTKLSSDSDIIDFAIHYETDKKMILYFIKQKGTINKTQLIRLAQYKYFDILKYIKQNNIHDEYTPLTQLVSEAKKEFDYSVKHLREDQSKKYKKEVVEPFDEIFKDVVDYNKMLRKAIYENDTKKVIEALKHNADPNQNSVLFDKQASLLMEATYKNNKEVVQTLIDHGADVMYKNTRGNSFLHIAAQNDILPIALKTKAKKYINDLVDMTLFKAYPLTVALFNGRYDNVKLLLKNGAKLTKETKKPVFCYIKKHELSELIEEFKKYGYKFEGIKCDKK